MDDCNCRWLPVGSVGTHRESYEKWGRSPRRLRERRITIEMSYSREKSAAIDAVARAVRLCQTVQADFVHISSLEKGDRSPVTVADFGAQALICRRLAEEYPYDVIVGEEDSSDLRNPDAARYLKQVTAYVQRFHPGVDSEDVCEWIDRGGRDVADRFWTVDPVDGTKGFLRSEQYAIALALIEDGQVRVGVLGCPVMPRSFAHQAVVKGRSARPRQSLCGLQKLQQLQRSQATHWMAGGNRTS